MPWINDCRKCKVEVPAGETCPHCDGKLTKTKERLAFMMARLPVRDWFAWNQWLRAVLPALWLVALLTLLGEGLTSGGRGIQALFFQGFFWTLAAVLGGMLLSMLVILLLQGKEYVRFVLDKDGVHAYTYVNRASSRRLYSRFLTWEAVEKLAADDHALRNLQLIRKADLGWKEIRRVRCWRETGQILFFRPSWWQAMVISCPPGEYQDAEAYLRKKMGKKAAILPKEP